MKTMLVTGGAGFIGSNFIIYILNKYSDYRVINLDKLTYAGNPQNLAGIRGNPNYSFVQGDIVDKDMVNRLFDEFEPDHVINFAAESHVDRSILDPEIFIKTNVLGTANLLNASRKCWQSGETFKKGKKYIQVSTDEVYGSLGETGFFTESTPLEPHSPYSASKAGADMIVKSYYDTFGMPVNITRCSNNYGSYQFPEKLIPLIINNTLNKKSLPVYGDGLNVRDWLYVEDHCKAIDMVLQYGKVGEVYNIGGNNERTNIAIVRKIIQILRENIDATISEELIKYVGDRKGHDRRYGIDASKIREELGWYPETCFDEGIQKTVEWYVENKAWIDNITSGEYVNYYKLMYEKEGQSGS